jgi:2-oxoglutarate dehydrogenase E2 component (dihydrolipoamide succinyltransferase)
MRHLLLTVVLPMLPLLVHAPGAAQPRDPMRAPSLAPAPGAAAARAGTGGAAPAPAPAVQPRHLLTANGCRYVVERGRRYGLGDTLGGARIEAIDDSGVTLREADNTRRRLPLYGAVAKREPADAAAAPAPERPPAATPAAPIPSLPPLARGHAARCTATTHPG